MITAEYIQHMGSDLVVANAARVSFAKESEWENTSEGIKTSGIESRQVLSTRDAKLIAYLASHDHFTPFTHCMITLRETVPIFVARQRFKHGVGFSYNEVSRRYVDDEPQFYKPEVWRKRADNVKQGSGDEQFINGNVLGRFDDLYELATISYREAISKGMAPEQARMVLPQATMTSYYVTGSLAAFARAYTLRTHDTAQREIQDLAKQWDAIIRPLFPVAWGALVDGGNPK